MDLDTGDHRVPIEDQLNQLIAHFDVLYRRLFSARPAPAATEVELSPQEMRVIMTLGRKGVTIMSDLARGLSLALSTATNTVDKLVTKELVERTRVDEDRRIVQIGLSEKGKRLHGEFHDFRLTMCRSMLEALSPAEREIFLELMAKMTAPAPASVEPEPAQATL
jgi:DNA-binding MarR family transcriptional regulator